LFSFLSSLFVSHEKATMMLFLPARGLVLVIKSVRFVVGRPGFDSLAESDQKTLKLAYIASLLDVQHKSGIVWR